MHGAILTGLMAAGAGVGIAGCAMIGRRYPLGRRPD